MVYDTEPQLKDLPQETYGGPFEWDENPADLNRWLSDGAQDE